MTDDDLINRGLRARLLLEAPEFRDALGELTNGHLSAIIDSAEDDAPGREKNFRLMRCYEAILETLQARIEIAAAITARRDQEEALEALSDLEDPLSAP